ncbi:MAG: hypothetical protein IAE79_21120 [Anaerolinea sp.]|nr:hypothetical protein [Anaerolinea sp.]
MLKQVLQAIETAVGPVNMAELSRQLGIERTALDGMIAYWVRKGRLQDDQAAEMTCAPAAAHCGPTCTGATTCAFVAKMPKSYSVPRE